MKISRIHIGHFGKLKEYTLDLENGFQILYGNNEDGKSTVMAFIRMMFYGSEGRSSDLSKNMRKKYLPWDGAKMSGYIEFEDNGIVYRLERLFGASNATDKISLWNTATGEKEKIASGTDIGQRFFGIGAAAFEKSVFIGQAGSMAGSGADKDDEITQRLLNLVSTGDESVSQKRVETRLRAAMDELKSKSGRIGVLDKKYQQLDRLVQERAAALTEEEEKRQLERRHAELFKKKEALEREYQNYKSQSLLQEQLVQLQNLDKILQKQKEIDRQTQDCREKALLLTAGDAVLDGEFVKNGQNMIARIEEVLSERNRNVRVLEEENVSCGEPAAEIAPEILENVKNQEKERAQTKQAIFTLKESIRCFSELEKKQSVLAETEALLREQTAQKQEQEDAFREVSRETEDARQSCLECRADLDRKKKEFDLVRQRKESAYTAHQAALQRLSSVQALSAQKTEIAEERLKQAGTPRQVVVNENDGRDLNKDWLIGAILVAVLSIAVGIFLGPVYFAGLVPAAVMGVLAFGRAKTKAVATTVVDEAETAAARLNLEEVRLAATRETEAAARAEKEASSEWEQAASRAEQVQKSTAQAEELCRMALEQLTAVERRKNELELKLEFISEKLSGLSKDVQARRADLPADGAAQECDLHSLQEELRAKSAREAALTGAIQTQLSGLGCRTIEELQDRHMQFQNQQARAAAKRESLNGARAAQAQAQASLNAELQSFIAFVSRYRPVSSYDEAVNAIRDLKNRMDEIRSAQLKIESQSEYLKEEMQGKTAEQIKREADALKEQILSANAGVMPEILDDQEIRQLKQLGSDRFEQLQKTAEAFIQLDSGIKNRFAGKKNVSELEEEMSWLKKEISQEEKEFEYLDLAQTTLAEAFNEIRQSFGPLLNEKTAKIFNSLTDGKYQNVIVSKNFDINVQDAENTVSHEWQYLSSGTIDQAYLALRLAVAGLLDGPKLPLFLDDVFLQYDDTRTKMGLKFLADYAGEGGGSQIILFPCHKNISGQAEQEGIHVATKNICRNMCN